MSSIRGVVFHSRFDYIGKHIDTATLKKGGEKLSSQAQQIIFDQIFPVNKYPFAVLKELDQALPQMVSLPPEQVFREMGKDFAHTILDRYFFNYIEAHKPQKFLTQFQKLYGNLWDFGQYECRIEENQKASVTLMYAEEVHREYTWFIEEFFKTGVEICNGKKVNLTRVSGNGVNDDKQIYTISWK